MISALDTHELVKDLKASGFTDAQAEAVTRAVKQSQDFSDLATKSDLALQTSELRSEINAVRGEIREVRAELPEEIAGVRAELQEEIAPVRGDLRAEIDGVRVEISGVRAEIGGIRAEIGGIRGVLAVLELRLIKWVVGVGIAATLAVGGMFWTVAQVLLRASPHL